MPQVIVKGISREKTAALAPRIAETVASIIAVPEEWIVVEHNEVAFFRGGKADARSAMVVIQWKQRPKELRKRLPRLWLTCCWLRAPDRWRSSIRIWIWTISMSTRGNNPCQNAGSLW